MTRMILESEVVVLILGGVGIAALGLYFGYILRNWSWIPRRKQRRGFGERW